MTMGKPWMVGAIGALVFGTLSCKGSDKHKPAREAEGPPHQTAAPGEPHAATAGVKFDIAFVIDSTQSMAKLIKTAKDRIRSIAAFVDSGTPKPSVRFAVVAYRDAGDAYVTRLYGFSLDISKTESALAAIRAGGGGDRPEHVVAGLRRAVSDLRWDIGAKLKFIFLIGDAEPQTKYADSDVAPVLMEAKKKGIKIGAISLTAMPEAGVVFWQHVAEATGGPAEGVAAEAAVESVISSAIVDSAKAAGVAYPVKAPQ